jgi:formylglycine-generating enzyme required for sulfatase activity
MECNISLYQYFPKNSDIRANMDTAKLKRIILSFTMILIALSGCNGTNPDGLEIGSSQISPADGMVQMYVPSGNFTMGWNEGKADEQPEHKVYLDAFWIDQTEVTVGQYRTCVEAGACGHPQQGVHHLRNSSEMRRSYYDNEQYFDYPVIFINWSQANTYCEWAGRRLPTEAEWEKAARGTDGRLYPWGNEEPNPSLLNFDGNIGDTTRVGSYPAGASPYGALDMAGNVWEWVQDWYDAEYYKESPRRNPTGPETGLFFIERGGSFKKSERPVRTTYRHWYIPPLVGNHVVSHSYDGFRCAASIE